MNEGVELLPQIRLCNGLQLRTFNTTAGSLDIPVPRNRRLRYWEIPPPNRRILGVSRPSRNEMRLVNDVRRLEPSGGISATDAAELGINHHTQMKAENKKITLSIYTLNQILL